MKYFLVVATLAVSVTLSACSDNDNSPVSAPTSTNSEEPPANEQAPNEGGGSDETDGGTTTEVPANGEGGTVEPDTGGENTDTPGNGGDTGTVGGGDLSSISGLWDYSYIHPVFGEDILYFEILPSGELYDYDYQQDEFDGGDNCYFIDGPQTIDALGDNEYYIAYPDEQDDGAVVTLIRDGNTLLISYIDTFDDDDDGDITEILTDSAVLISGISSASFNECEF